MPDRDYIACAEDEISGLTCDLTIVGGACNMHLISALALATLLFGTATVTSMAEDKPALATPVIAVGPQYDTVHVYVAPADLERLTDSLVATFGGTKSQQATLTITPTPSETMWQAVFAPVGTFSVFGFMTPIPYPFGAERTGYLVTDMDTAIQSAKTNGADIVVEDFKDPLGRDAIIRWPGGVYMQLYWHTTAPNYANLQTVPENRVYVSPDRADAFVRAFVGFSHGKIVSDEGNAPGIEVGKPEDTYRRVRIDSTFGKIAVLVTDGQLPYPYGREVIGYEVGNLADTLTKAKTAGATVLVESYTDDRRHAAIVSFPGGYIAEIHSAARQYTRKYFQGRLRRLLTIRINRRNHFCRGADSELRHSRCCTPYRAEPRCRGYARLCQGRIALAPFLSGRRRPGHSKHPRALAERDQCLTST